MHWTKPKLARFIVALEAAKQVSDDPFTFEGNEYLISYATYLVEYLKSRLK